MKVAKTWHITKPVWTADDLTFRLMTDEEIAEKELELDLNPDRIPMIETFDKTGDAKWDHPIWDYLRDPATQIELVNFTYDVFHFYYAGWELEYRRKNSAKTERKEKIPTGNNPHTSGLKRQRVAHYCL